MHIQCKCIVPAEASNPIDHFAIVTTLRWLMSNIHFNAYWHWFNTIIGYSFTLIWILDRDWLSILQSGYSMSNWASSVISIPQYRPWLSVWGWGWWWIHSLALIITDFIAIGSFATTNSSFGTAMSTASTLFTPSCTIISPSGIIFSHTTT